MMHGQLSPDFRRHGERRHTGRRLNDLRAVNLDVERLLHELQVQRAALEVQNDELRQAQAQEKKITEELLRSNRELQQYAYIAAHDLQAPLRTIGSFAQLLQEKFRGQMGTEADVWIDRLVDHVHRMQNLIRDLLEYSRIDSQGHPFEPTDLGRIFDEVTAAAAPAIRESGATVTRDDLPTVVGDHLQLAQVMQNLIENAIKYHEKEPPRVHVSASRKADGWVLSIRDNGIGIAEKHHQDVFEIFRRLHSQHSYPGTGIGLAICHRVVHRHGGRIWVESEPGKGSTFRFTLPDHPSPA